LLRHIEEYGKCVLTTGFRNIKIKDANEFFKMIRQESPSSVKFQSFDARFVATWEHLYFAVLNALTAFKNEQNISNSLEMETMLYASAQRQIRKAVELLGITPDTSNIAVLIIGEKPETLKSALSIVSKHVNAQPDDTVLELSEEKTAKIRKTFEISDVEVESVMKKGGLEKTLIDLVIERMALLTTQR
jgi:tRNA threonylcarbamoyladenosine modification (KEOPS) complex Cgi121 subunit